jgi:glyoxylase-like metal-dependent hydrolase (beta-lactamase superfamily II)
MTTRVFDKIYKIELPIPFQSMTWTAIHCRGHSLGLLCFLNVSENVFPFRYPGLREYLISLEKIERMDLSLLLPGHGEMIHDSKGLIQKVFAHHRERTELITAILSKGDKTPFEITMALFPGVPPFEVFLGISEAVGHLEILREENRVRVTEKEGIDIYSLQI